jgi:hypothetical protein
VSLTAIIIRELWFCNSARGHHRAKKKKKKKKDKTKQRLELLQIESESGLAPSE